MNPLAQNPDDLIDDGDPKRGRMEELEMENEELQGALQVADAENKRLRKKLRMYKSYLRAANKGAERHSLIAQLECERNVKLAARLHGKQMS